MLPLRELGIRQRKAELICVYVDGTGTAAITEGKYLATLTDNGTGDYTITLNSPAARNIHVVGAMGMGTVDVRPSITALSATAVRIVWEVSGTDTDTEFYLTLIAFYTAEQN